ARHAHRVRPLGAAGAGRTARPSAPGWARRLRAGRPQQPGRRLIGMHVLLAGGGTAGHTSPLLATADALLRRDPEVQITCVGTARGLETRVVPAAGHRLEVIPPVPLPRRPGVELLRTPARLRRAVKEAGAVSDRVAPAGVGGYGGSGSSPGVHAAPRRGPAVLIH